MGNYNGALVSAIITTHDRADLLPRAIDSALHQTYHNLEILVVDDGSIDDTEKVIRTYQEKYDKVRYLKHDTPKGACEARNHGIREARGEFVTGLDDDDEWLPKRVEVLLKNFRDEYAYVCSSDHIIHKNRTVCRKWRPIITLESMLYQNVTGNQVLTKRERIIAVGGFDEVLTAGQDYDLWLRLLERYGSARMIGECLQKVYRNHGSERISVSKMKLKGEWSLYKKHKSKMSKKQKRLHLIELKRLKGRKIYLYEIIDLFNTEFFSKYINYFFKMWLKKWLTLCNF